MRDPIVNNVLGAAMIVGVACEATKEEFRKRYDKTQTL